MERKEKLNKKIFFLKEMINTSDNKMDVRDSDHPVVCFGVKRYLRESYFSKKCLKLSN